MSEHDDKRYLAIIGDLVRSRAIADRAQLQERLLAEIEAVNREYADRLVVPVSMTAGDEFEVLLDGVEPVVALLIRFADTVLPNQLAFGVGAGGLTTRISEGHTKRAVGELDGEVFHRARSALNQAAGDASWALIEGFGEGEDAALSGLTDLLGNLRRGWTGKQAAYVAAARQAKQLDVARRFGVGQSVVSESLKAAQFELTLRSEARLHSALTGLF